MAAGSLILTATAFPQAGTEHGEGQAIVTILPPKDMKTPINIPQQDVQVKVNGKKSSITDWGPILESNRSLELVILIDDVARESLTRQLDEIILFLQHLPANVKVALGYMVSGSVDMTGPFSTDRAEVASKLRKGIGFNGNPYFSLSDLAKHWPSKDPLAQHETVLITTGVDMTYGFLDHEDPYIKAAIADSIRAGLVVNSISWGGTNVGLMLMVTRATGGGYCCDGPPRSLSPCFGEIALRLQNQYRLGFHSDLKGKPAIQSIEIEVGNPAAKVYAPQRVFVAPMKGE
jgi:hypothetical protein